MKNTSILKTFIVTAMATFMLMIPQVSWADSDVVTVATANEFNEAAAAATDFVSETTEDITKITLTDEITGNLVVPEGKAVKLILNNHNITADSGVVITNNGELLIEGEGTITAGSSYAVVNHGTMGIYGGTFNKADPAKTASLIENGWYNAGDRPEGANAAIAIHGGTFDGGTYTALKNDSYGVMVILGGTINTTPNAYGQYNVVGVQECGSVLSIKGGTFNCGVQLENTSSYEDEEKGIMINGGTFNGDVKTKGINTASAIKAASVSLAIGQDAVFNKSLSISNSGAPAGTNPFTINLFLVKEIGGTLTLAGRDSETPMNMEELMLDGFTIGGGLILSNTTECTVSNTVVNGSSGIKAGNVTLNNVEAKVFANNAKDAIATLSECNITKINPTYNAGNTIYIYNSTIDTIQNTGTNSNAGFESIEIINSEVNSITTAKGNLALYDANIGTLTLSPSSNQQLLYIGEGTSINSFVNNRDDDENTQIMFDPGIHFDDEGNLVYYPAVLNGSVPYESIEDAINDCLDNDLLTIYVPADLVFPESGHNALVQNRSGEEITVNGRTLLDNESISVEVVVLKNKVDQLTSEKETLEAEKATLTTNLANATTRAETVEAEKAAIQTQLNEANANLIAAQTEYNTLLETYTTTNAELTAAKTTIQEKQAALEGAQAALAEKQEAYDALIATHTATTAELTQAQTELTQAQNNLTAAQTALAEKQTEYAALLEQYNTTSTALTQAQTDLQSAQTTLSAKETELANAQTALTEKQTAYDTLLATHNATTSELTQAQTDLQDAQTALTAKETELANAQTALTEKQAAYDALLTAKNSADADLSQAQTELANAQANVTNLTNSLTAKTAELDSANATIATLTASLNAVNNDLAAATSEKQTMQTSLTKAQSDLSKAQADLAAAEAARKSAESEKDKLASENKALKDEIDLLTQAKEAAEKIAAEAREELAKYKAGTTANTPSYTPGKVKLTKVTKGKKKATVKFKTLSKNVTGYEIRLIDKKTKKAKTVKVANSNKKTISKTIKKLKKNASYRVNVRAYNTVNGMTYYGSWSATKTVKVK